MTEPRVEITWSYTPADFFKDRVVWPRDGYSYEIEHGCIIVSMNEGFFDSHPGLCDFMTQELISYLLLWNLTQQIAHEVCGWSIARISPSGGRSLIKVINETLAIKETLGYRDDKSQERFEAMKKFIEHAVPLLVDPTARKILDSFHNAIKTPTNELVYLYEVWEALKTKFQGDLRARKALAISRRARSRLTKLADFEPINQGRHRGKHIVSLRDATAKELDEARKIAQDMIERYLNYLDEQQRPS